ncbi:autotransporter outer membrane beta-barrel domain-containing protein [Thiohalocapsa marina]|nr:autotransporter outer membrane beta-barrel domain-containing protein [Thiohalocapsa marina]
MPFAHETCASRSRSSRARRRIAGFLLAALSVAAQPAAAFTLTPSGVVELALSPNSTVSQAFSVALGPDERFLDWEFNGLGNFVPSADQAAPRADYSFSDPGNLQHCEAVSGIATGVAATVTARIYGAAAPPQETAEIHILYEDPLAMSGSAPTLEGVPGERLSFSLGFSGGRAPYSATSTLGASVTTSGGQLSYQYVIPPGTPGGTLTDTVVLAGQGTACGGDSVRLTVTIKVLSGLSVTPSALELSALSLVGVATEASQTFSVNGGRAPYNLAILGGNGRVDPTRLDQAGSATYSVTIPADASASTLSDSIVVTDAAGSRIEVPVTVNISASNSLSGRHDLTPNQRNVARAIETVCPQLALMPNRNAEQEDLFRQCSDMLANASGSAIPGTLDQITTEKARAATSAAVEAGNQQLANIGSRLAALRRGTTGLSLQGLAVNIDGQTLSVDQVADAVSAQMRGGAAGGDSPFGRWGFFLNGSFNFGDKDATDNEAGFDFNTTGVTAGADYRFTDKFIAGGALGFGQSNVSFDSSGGDLDTDTWHLAAYGTYSWTDRAYVDAILEYGWHSYDSKRNIRYQVASSTSAVNRRARADYDGTQFGASVGAGYDFTSGPLSYGLYGRAGYIDVDVDGYNENGADGLNLSLDGFGATSVTTTLGARVSRVFNTATAVFVPQARIEWEHEYDQDADTLVARFAADPTATSFNIETDSPDRDYFRVGLGLSAVFPHGLSAFINYDTVLDRQYWSDHVIDVGLRWELY